MKPITYLNIAQFFGALNDYVFRFLFQFYLIDIFVARNSSFSNATIAEITAALFIFPFLILTPIAGIFADRIKKERSIIIIKFIEVGVALLGVLGFYFHNIPLVVISFIGLASHSAIFSPIKYGIISELVKKEDLTRANGLIEGLTYVAIVVGPLIAGLLNEFYAPNYHYSAIYCLGFAIIGLISAFKIKNANHYISRQKFSWYFFLKPFSTIYQIQQGPYLLASLLGSIMFFFIAGFAQLNLLPYGIEVFNLSKESAANLFTFGAIGIALGSFLAGILSKKLIEFGIVPIGIFIVSMASLAIGFIPKSLMELGFWIFMFGVGSGIFLVPLHTFIQYQSPVKLRSNMLAANTFFSLFSVAVATLVSSLILTFGFTIAEGFIFLGVITLLVHLLTLVILPDFLIRLIGVSLLKLFYKVKTVNEDVVPREGGALLIPNHVSYVDALILAISLQRRIRFIMWDEIYYSNKFVTVVCKIMRVIPISLKNRQESEVALIQARKALEDGWLVCIFAEGGLTRTGTIGYFKSGFENILKESSFPIVPIYLHGLWESYFSLNRNKSLSNSKIQLPFPVTIYFGELLNSNSSAKQTYYKVKELEYKAISESKTEIIMPSLAEDPKKKYTRDELIKTSLGFAKELRQYENKFGVLIPASTDSLVTNLAIAINGGTIFNLNYTYTPEQLQELIEELKITNLIATEKLKDKYKNLKNINWISVKSEKSELKAYSITGKNVLATSGTSGKCKLVIHNLNKILLNAKSVSDIFLPKRNEIILSALPHFHSFGLTGSVWLPVVSGASIYYLRNNPLAAKSALEVIKEKKINYLITTPSFLKLYLKVANKDDLQTLKLIVTGGEPLSTELKEQVAELGLKIIEGYGATELGPVVAVKIPTAKDETLTPLPGVMIRTKDLNSENVISGEIGTLEVRSVSTMDGYLDTPFNYRWYRTGDLAIIDKYNNLKIAGRLSRFSKIAGEMVSHQAVEEAINSAVHNLVCVVYGIPCENYGEKLVLAYNKNLITKEKIEEIFKSQEFPNLWKVKSDNYIPIEELPLLATGKPDLIKIKNICEQLILFFNKI